jgi:hypothetical protein
VRAPSAAPHAEQKLPLASAPQAAQVFVGVAVMEPVMSESSRAGM